MLANVCQSRFPSSKVITLCCAESSFFFLIYDSHTEREREAETQAEGEAGSMHREPDVGFDPGSPELHPGPKAGAKPLHHPGIPCAESSKAPVMKPQSSSVTTKQLMN